MVTINYQTFGKNGFQLRLRLYQSGESRYVAVNKLLKGAIQKKHWNQKKQRFIPSAPYSEENNAILVKFRQKYDEAAIGWNGSLYGLMASLDPAPSESDEGLAVVFIDKIISELRQRTHPDGTVKGSYEGYAKLKRRLEEFCEAKKIRLDRLRVTDITPSFVDDMFGWIQKSRGGKGYVYISSMLHAVLMRADKEELIEWPKYRRCKWRGKNKETAAKYHTLSPAQCRRFAELKAENLPNNPKSDLYHDFCLFLLYTGQSPCDAISLKYSDIKSIGGTEHFVFKRRKIAEKQSVPCAVPINPVMKSIMEKWRAEAKDGYVFPIRNNGKLKAQKTENGDIKHFVGRLNLWLKKVGQSMELSFPLHTYVFRHTAITNYLSKGVPIIYVANLMGTSVKNCEKIYYNNLGDKSSRDMVLQAVMF